ncbi:hypothetical protein [Zoogloea sp.]|jgi:hypothetical protein|uniref:hypothetical protein n=1 Tax=Zoogloea sp. TaxID=49181 RepID=UPI00260876FA|nr:hypothetical protein [Zoogloea sp.]MDD2991748.1 hypothetical protein [Zoogloea sp.]
MSAMLAHWELEHYRQLYRDQIDRLVDTLTVRLLPTFESVHAEVEAIQREAYHANHERANDGNWLDPQMAHDVAFEASIMHFDIVLDLRQGLQNMFAVTLYHLFEQQVRTFHVRVLNHKPLKFGSDVLKAWDKTLTDPVLSTEQRSGLDELRLLANTVKHGDGASAQELYTAAPHLFLADYEQDVLDDPTVVVHKPDIGTPLFGQDLFVRLDDIQRYRQLLNGVWSAYLEALGAGRS